MSAAGGTGGRPGGELGRRNAGEPDWGFIEEIGPEGGMRGVFRNTFRIVLLGDG